MPTRPARPEVVCIIQARMGSTRLPGKVLADLAGEPMLARVIERARRAKRVDKVVVATTDLPQDDVLVALCRERGWLVTRGSERDVLDRYAKAAREHGGDVIVRVTSDCPLLSPALVDDCVGALLDALPAADYACNTLPPRTYPRGLDVEAVSREALERAWRDDPDPATREHVTPYIYRHPAAFRLVRVAGGADHSRHRWTVDTPADLAFARAVYGALGASFEWRDALRFVEARPDVAGINAEVVQKEVP